MLRKRRQPAPNFRMPGAPFNPATGERAPLGAYPGRGTTLALFQVVGDDPQDPETADTHDNYVVCRGYEADADPNFRYLHDPYTKPDTTPINVAKPYSLRGTFPYTQGQVIVAARIKGRLGYNAGKAATVGQPEDLDDELELLTDDSDAGIAWLDITQPPGEQYGLIGAGGQALGGGVATPGVTLDLTFDLGHFGTASLLDFTAGSGQLVYNGDSPRTFANWFTAQLGASVPSGADARIRLGPLNTTTELITSAVLPEASLPTPSSGTITSTQQFSCLRFIIVNPGDVLKCQARAIGSLTINVAHSYWFVAPLESF